MDVHSIENKFNLLTDELQKEVIHFIEFLLSRKETKSVNQKDLFQFPWEGALSDIKKENSSVELQHRSMDWR